jgi:predicted acetyltransferase
MGTAVLRQILKQYPGKWEIPVAHYNLPALSFWKSALSVVPLTKLSEHSIKTEHWNGPVFSFTFSASISEC